MIGLASIFYGLCLAVAFIWGALAGRPNLFFYDMPRFSVAAWGWGAFLGLCFGFAVVGLSRLFESYFSWAKELIFWFGEILGKISPREALILALLSAVGEEALFRGAIQPTIGLWLTSLLFGLVHFPPRRRYWPWTAMATVIGLCFGIMTVWTKNLSGALLAHFIINFVNLMHVGRVVAKQRSEPSISPNPPIA